MKLTQARLTLASRSPYSQSRQHDEPMLEGESRDAFDARTWRAKLNTATHNGEPPSVVIPAHGLAQAIAAAAPKVQTLREAVRAYLECPSPLAGARAAMREALAREEGGA